MKKEKGESSLAVALSLVGAFVGAGFISGQELTQFFVRFGWWGIIGWLIVVITIIWGSGFVLEKVSMLKVETFDGLVHKFFNSYWVGVVNLIINGYLLGGLVIMLSGAGNLLSSVVKIHSFWGTGLVAIAVLVTILGKAKRLLKANKILVPILIVLTVIVSVKVLSISGWKLEVGSVYEIKNPSPMLANWWVSLFLYIGYNAIGAIVALVNIAHEVTPKQGRIGGRLGGMVVGLLGSMILLTLFGTYPGWAQDELPLVNILKANFSWLYPVFVPAMLIAMFTVAIAYALGLAKYISVRFGWKFDNVCIGLMLMTAPIALLGFSRLLGIIYPFFGIMATGIMLFLVGWQMWRHLQTKFDKRKSLA